MDSLSLIDDKMASLLSNRVGKYCHTNAINDGIIFVPEEMAKRMHAEKHGDNVFDFISYYRTDISLDWDRLSIPAVKRGLYTGKNSSQKAYTGFKAVPVNIRYKVIYWTKYKLKVNAFIEDMLFFQYENPQVCFTVGDDDVPVEFDFFISSVNEHISNWFDEGRYFKLEMIIDLRAWLFKSTYSKLVETIHIDMYEKESKILFYQEDIV